MGKDQFPVCFKVLFICFFIDVNVLSIGAHRGQKKNQIPWSWSTRQVQTVQHWLWDLHSAPMERQ